MAKDSPGVYLPPPLIYVACFFIGLGLQRLLPLPPGPGPSVWAQGLAVCCFVLAALLAPPALLRFLRTRNTLVTALPARSLQTGGIYAYSRNPMYAGLLLVYTGLALLLGNWWTLLLIPVLVWAVQRVVILPEERYLQRAFGADYTAYMAKVRRWIGSRGA
jgi:protein-S-isoprenylcysteine O-methyltransferase Ste14